MAKKASTKKLKRLVAERKRDVAAVRKFAAGGGNLKDSARLARIQTEPRPMQRTASGDIVKRKRRKKR